MYISNNDWILATNMEWTYIWKYWYSISIWFCSSKINKLIITNLSINCWYSYPQLQTIVQLLEGFHGFDGIRHLMLVMFQIMSFQKCLWLLLWIYVMIQISQWMPLSFLWIKKNLLIKYSSSNETWCWISTFTFWFSSCL